MNHRLIVSPIVILGIIGVCSLDGCSSSSSGGTPETDASTNDSATADTGSTADAANDASDAATDATTDSGPVSDAGCAPFTGSAPGAADAQCHDLVNAAPMVSITVDPNPMPVGTGGEYADGLYYLTEVKTYPGSLITGVTFKQTYLLKSGKVYSVQENSDHPAALRQTKSGGFDGGVSTVDCSTDPSKIDIPPTSYTATCTEIITYNTTYLFSAKLTRQQ